MADRARGLCADCRGPLFPRHDDDAVGPIAAETFSYGGVDRHYCTYTSSLIGVGAQAPLVIALHGGDGNASQMMEDARRIIARAESSGYIAVFPNGLPKPSCGGSSPCLDNNWAQPDNVFFIAELISRMKAGGQVLDDRVHLIGFSGGAQLIYNVAATPGFPHAIRSVATVAGALGLFHADRPEEGFSVIQLDQGAPVSALLAQGGLDLRAPAAGGLDETGLEFARLVSHQGRLLAAGHRHCDRARRNRSTSSPWTRTRRRMSPPSATPMPG